MIAANPLSPHFVIVNAQTLLTIVWFPDLPNQHQYFSCNIFFIQLDWTPIVWKPMLTMNKFHMFGCSICSELTVSLKVIIISCYNPWTANSEIFVNGLTEVLAELNAGHNRKAVISNREWEVFEPFCEVFELSQLIDCAMHKELCTDHIYTNEHAFCISSCIGTPIESVYKLTWVQLNQSIQKLEKHSFTSYKWGECQLGKGTDVSCWISRLRQRQRFGLWNFWSYAFHQWIGQSPYTVSMIGSKRSTWPRCSQRGQSLTRMLSLVQ